LIDPRAIRTGRLVLTPVNWTRLSDLIRIKSDPRVFATMLGGVRNAAQVAEDLEIETALWARRGFGLWIVDELRPEGRNFHGIAGLMERSDGRGVALRYGLFPESRGRGLAREAAGAALRFGHDNAGLRQIVAVTRADNFDSRALLGAIGMREVEQFARDGFAMLTYASER
jgi:RimJ/RimL family protein N-acetyltransferase